jgi:mannose/fructose-specific phosphotransferase system component IIA
MFTVHFLVDARKNSISGVTLPLTQELNELEEDEEIENEEREDEQVEDEEIEDEQVADEQQQEKFES